ncbi:hypothetical protein RSAG8_04728, partial [Rhizoctonia solani AG-8 WAC10335]
MYVSDPCREMNLALSAFHPRKFCILRYMHVGRRTLIFPVICVRQGMGQGRVGAYATHVACLTSERSSRDHANADETA